MNLSRPVAACALALAVCAAAPASAQRATSRAAPAGFAPEMTPTFPPSGKTDATFSISSATATTCAATTAACAPNTGQPFNIRASGCTATAALENSVDGGSSWLPVTIFGTPVTFSITPTQGVNETWSEARFETRYRLNFGAPGSYTSGTCSVGFYQ